jgi:hypothetical protein
MNQTLFLQVIFAGTVNEQSSVLHAKKTPLAFMHVFKTGGATISD